MCEQFFRASRARRQEASACKAPVITGNRTMSSSISPSRAKANFGALKANFQVPRAEETGPVALRVL